MAISVLHIGQSLLVGASSFFSSAGTNFVVARFNAFTIRNTTSAMLRKWMKNAGKCHGSCAILGDRTTQQKKGSMIL